VSRRSHCACADIPNILDLGVQQLAAPYNNTIDRNTGLLKHFPVILGYTLYMAVCVIVSVKVVASGAALVLFCKIPKESERGMKRK